MRKLLVIFLILTSCGSEESSDPTPTKNTVETIVLGGDDKVLAAFVEYFWQRAENSKITYERGVTVKAIQVDESDGILIDNSTFSKSTKTISLDTQYLKSLFGKSETTAQVWVNKYVCKVIAPQNSSCIDKVTDFMDQAQLLKLTGREQEWVDTMVGASSICPM
jgi:hypothetical protein